jgi:hypothetical protein
MLPKPRVFCFEGFMNERERSKHRIGMEVFLDNGEGFIGRLLGENSEERIPNKREIGQEVGVSTP